MDIRVLVAGIMIGFGLGVKTSMLVYDPIKEQVDSIITECEKQLPRDKHCKLIGVFDE